MRTLVATAALVFLTSTACQKKTNTDAAPSPSGSASTASADCTAFKKAICDKAGTDSQHCLAMGDLVDVFPPAVCAAGLGSLPALTATLATEMKPCNELVERLCKDLGSETDSCKMVRVRTPSFPPKQCKEMVAQYPSVLAELQKQEDKTKPLDTAKQASILAGARSTFGHPDSKVKLVEFSDFECPFCAKATTAIDTLRQKYGDKVYFVFRQFPLEFHADAHLAAEASLAAGAQGKFWEFHDKMFGNQSAIKRADLEKYAKEVGLDVAKFKSALDTGAYKAAVDEELALGKTVHVEGTPTLFLNGKTVPNISDVPALTAAIDAQLAQN
jgi:protein-disulfide isomerase